MTIEQWGLKCQLDGIRRRQGEGETRSNNDTDLIWIEGDDDDTERGVCTPAMQLIGL
jgi:hypothetical protein